MFPYLILTISDGPSSQCPVSILNLHETTVDEGLSSIGQLRTHRGLCGLACTCFPSDHQGLDGKTLSCYIWGRFIGVVRIVRTHRAEGETSVTRALNVDTGSGTFSSLAPLTGSRDGTGRLCSWHA